MGTFMRQALEIIGELIAVVCIFTVPLLLLFL